MDGTDKRPESDNRDSKWKRRVPIHHRPAGDGPEEASQSGTHPRTAMENSNTVGSRALGGISAGPPRQRV